MKLRNRILLLCLGLFMVICGETDAKAQKPLNVCAVAESKTTVTVSWNRKKSVSGYIIYRREMGEENEDAGPFQKLATVSAKTASYRDKTVTYQKRYEYLVKSYEIRKNKKTRYLYEGRYCAYVGLCVPHWEEEIYSDYETTPQSIELSGITNDMQPDGYVIYRKEQSGKYKKIKTIKTKTDYRFHYVDKKVSKGKNYTYKFRTYKFLNGKKVYSKYSDAIQKSAVNQYPQFTLQNVTQTTGKVKQIVVGLTSKEGNADVLFLYQDGKRVNAPQYYTSADKANIELVPVQYSYDNVNWQSFPENGLLVSENDTVYFMFQAQNGEEIELFPKEGELADIGWEVKYHAGLYHVNHAAGWNQLYLKLTNQIAKTELIY